MYFLKRNWKNLTVFVLAVACIVLWICTLRIGSVDETQRISRSVSGAYDRMSVASGGAVSGSIGIGDGISEENTQKATDAISSTEKTQSDASDKDKKDKPKESSDKAKKPAGKGDNKSPERKNSDGKGKGKDKFGTDPVPKGKPEPVNEEDQKVTKDYFYVYLSIDCETILDHMDELTEGLDKYVGDGTILKKTKVKCYNGESVWDVLSRECKAREINLESEYTPVFGSVYVEAINNLGEFDCGELSGWCYCVDGWYPNYGASRYVLKKNEYIRWRYTCDLGRDIGSEWK